MNNLYIFDSKYKTDEIQVLNTFVFFYQPYLDFDEYINTLSQHFQISTFPEKIYLLIPSYLSTHYRLAASEKVLDFEKAIPIKFHRDRIHEFVVPLYYDIQGELTHNETTIVPELKAIVKKACNDAMVHIFKCRDGLIKSENAHHFVFPSGKHCDNFLRPGNILQKGNEIMFIAFNLLHKLSPIAKAIYCDTSSINSLAYALIELKRNFATTASPVQVPLIESFGSYTAFEKNDFTVKQNSLILVSSSTSARILERLTERKIELSQIGLIYCMGNPSGFRESIICDLQYDEKTNENGIKPFTSYLSADDCKFCRIGSIPVEVTGDVFQLEKPKINKIMIKVTDAPRFLNDFVRTFHRRAEQEFEFIKSHHFERLDQPGLAQPSYEIFIDVEGLFDKLEKFPNFKAKLDKYINHHIPAKTRFIIHLPDNGSKKLAGYIMARLSEQVKDPTSIRLIDQSNVTNDEEFKKVKDEDGCIVIVCSSLVGGSRLLYLSREMRDYPNFSLVYFVAFARPDNEPYLNFLKGNLVMSKFQNTFVNVELLFTPNDRQNTSWVVEEHFLASLLRFCQDKGADFAAAIPILEQRLDEIEKGYRNKGLYDKLFYPNVCSSDHPLEINKNFAFFKFDKYHRQASQADIYFTMAAILNNLRNNPDADRKLINTQFTRTLLEADNFNRFNDGVIQAAILRASHTTELSYDFDKAESYRMLTILVGIVEFCDQPHGEALAEFLYAIAIRKLRLKKYHLEELIGKIEKHPVASINPVIKSLTAYIKVIHLDSDETAKKPYELKLDML